MTARAAVWLVWLAACVGGQARVFNTLMDLIWFQCADGFKVHNRSHIPNEGAQAFDHWGRMTGTGLDEDEINVVTHTCTRKK